ncbi:unnamed protein product, partial [Mesorhabditis spiculigera]
MPECGGSTSRLFDENSEFHARIIVALQGAYGQMHQMVSFLLCVLGVMANILHITILTRPVMKRSAVNRLLALMAVCDTITMIDYLLYLIRFGIMVDPNDPPYGYPYVWICYLIGHVVASIALHSISLYLSVATAFIRLMAIARVQSTMMRPRIAWKIFVGIATLMTLLIIPTFYVHQIVQSEMKGEYMVVLPQDDDIRCVIFIVNLWLTGIFFKVIPCILLFAFTIGLLYKLHLNKISHEKIASKQSIQMRCAQSDRTTILLILLLAVFLITELPQGILALLNALYTEDVNRYLYSHLGEFFDLLSLVNGCICFILYPCISSQYRETFSLLIARLRSSSMTPYRQHSPQLSRLAPASQCCSVETDYPGQPSENRLLEVSEVNL